MRTATRRLEFPAARPPSEVERLTKLGAAAARARLAVGLSCFASSKSSGGGAVDKEDEVVRRRATAARRPAGGCIGLPGARNAATHASITSRRVLAEAPRSARETAPGPTADSAATPWRRTSPSSTSHSRLEHEGRRLRRGEEREDGEVGEEPETTNSAESPATSRPTLPPAFRSPVTHLASETQPRRPRPSADVSQARQPHVAPEWLRSKSQPANEIEVRDCAINNRRGGDRCGDLLTAAHGF